MKEFYSKDTSSYGTIVQNYIEIQTRVKYDTEHKARLK